MMYNLRQLFPIFPAVGSCGYVVDNELAEHLDTSSEKHFEKELAAVVFKLSIRHAKMVESDGVTM